MFEKDLKVWVYFDRYGDLLSPNKRAAFEAYYGEDLSLAEIAQETGTSRQAVWDIIRRAEESLRRFEDKTGLVGRFAAQKELLSRAERLTGELLPLTDGPARTLAGEIMDTVQELRHGI